MSLDGHIDCHDCDEKTLKIMKLENQILEIKGLLEAAFTPKADLFTGVQAVQAAIRVSRMK